MQVQVFNVSLRDIDPEEEMFLISMVFSTELCELKAKKLLIDKVNAVTAGWAGPYTVKDLADEGRLCWTAEKMEISV